MEKKRMSAAATHKEISTLSGNTTVIYSVESVTLGQAVVVVAGSKVYHMAALWDRMSKEEAEGANEGAFAGKMWIEDHPAADTRGNDMRALHGGAACCEHTGYPQHLVNSVKAGMAMIVGRVKPQEQMADSIVVGSAGSLLPRCEVCTRWRIHKGVVPRFRQDGSIYQINQRSNGEVPDESMPGQLLGPLSESETTVAPTPRSFTCSSEYDYDPHGPRRP